VARPHSRNERLVARAAMNDRWAMSMIAKLFAVPMSLLEQLKNDPAVREEWLGDTSELDALALGKEWHAIHFLLNGVAGEAPPPLGLVVFGGVPVSADDMGYGPATLRTADEVRAIAKALAPIDEDTLGKRFDPARMDALEIYPTVWQRDGAEGLDAVADTFQRLKTYYTKAAKKGLAMLVWIE